MQDEEVNQEDQADTEESVADQTTEAAGEGATEDLAEQLKEAQAQVLYIKAEGENIRRRAAEDIDKARKFAIEKFSSELLAVKDSLDGRF